MKIQRILVALDASPHSMAALEVAARFAAMHRAELTGVFVEDVNLLRLAGLPFAREMIYPATLGRQIEAPMMKERLKELAEAARQALSEAALRAGADWAFHVRHGSIRTELLHALEEHDLLVLGKASHMERQRWVRVGSTAASLLIRASRPVLALQQGEVCRGPVMIVCDGSEESIALLPRALEFSTLFDGRTILLLRAPNREEAAALRDRIEAEIHLPELRFRRCSPSEPGGLARLAHEEDVGLLVLTGAMGAVPEEIPTLLEQIHCPVLAYR